MLWLLLPVLAAAGVGAYVLYRAANAWRRCPTCGRFARLEASEAVRPIAENCGWKTVIAGKVVTGDFTVTRDTLCCARGHRWTQRTTLEPWWW